MTDSRWGDLDPQDVTDLYADYAALLDAGDFASWLQLFCEDADYRAIARENLDRALPLATIRCDSRAMLADRIHAVTTTQFFVTRTMRHVVSAIRPSRVDGDGLSCTANFVVLETIPGETTTVHAAGTYDDRIARTSSGLRFVVKHAIYDAALVPTSLIMPL